MNIIDILSEYPDFSESTAMETCDEDYRIYILVNKQLNLNKQKPPAPRGSKQLKQTNKSRPIKAAGPRGVVNKTQLNKSRRPHG